MAGLTARTEAWRQTGALVEIRGHRIFVRERDGDADGPPLRDWTGRLELAWAERDPICTEAVLEAVLELRPYALVTRLPGLGHYPQIEDPAAVYRVIERHAAAGRAG